MQHRSVNREQGHGMASRHGAARARRTAPGHGRRAGTPRRGSTAGHPAAMGRARRPADRGASPRCTAPRRALPWRDGLAEDARGAQPGNGTAAPSSEQPGPGRGAGRWKEALPGAGPPPEPPRLHPALGRARRSPPRGPAPAGRPREAVPRPRGRRTGGPVPRPPRARPSRGQRAGPSSEPRTLPLPPGPAAARTGREAPPAPLGPTTAHKEPSPARPGPPPLPALRGRRQARTTPGTMEKRRDGRRTWLAGGRGRGRSPCPAAGGGAAGPGPGRLGGGAGPSGGRAEMQPGPSGPLHPRGHGTAPRCRASRPVLPARGVEGAAPPDPRRPRGGPGPAAALRSARGLPAPVVLSGCSVCGGPGSRLPGRSTPTKTRRRSRPKGCT